MSAGIWIDHLKAVRIPLFIAFIALVLTFWVDQIKELFFLLALDSTWQQKVAAWVASLLLGLAVWHTSRTVYRFDTPELPGLSDPEGAGLRTWMPRVLGVLFPVLMAVGCGLAVSSPSNRSSYNPSQWLLPISFFAQAVFLFWFFTRRRHLLHNRNVQLGATPAQDARVRYWSELPAVRNVYLVIIAANLLALIAVAWFPGFIARLGPISIVLLAATFTTATGTVLSILAARWRLPLFTMLFVLAVAWQALGWNDNHRIRLYPKMNSDEMPDAALVDKTTRLPVSFIDYAQAWSATLPTDAPIYMVSAEGGGIRAAAWTALVLAQLEAQSKGRFSQHMLAGSGISGGSLGLALFAAMIKARELGMLETHEFPKVAQEFLDIDYLGPALETMLLTDLLQRFWPMPAFIDRGQRLEVGWEDGWRQAMHCKDRPKAQRAACAIFSRPWGELWKGKAHIPALFFNSTIVQSGQRFIQTPFMADDLFTSAVTSTQAGLPLSAPLSAVVHNSSRFTYISPAGTLLLPEQQGADRKSPLQLVDGGYFENSGATTLIEVALHLTRDESAGSRFKKCAASLGAALSSRECPLRFIHISNSSSVESLFPEDVCPVTASEPQYGEVRAPLSALLHTRNARAALARQSLSKLYRPAPTPGDTFELASMPEDTSRPAPTPKDTFGTVSIYHFRLCQGTHRLPLGWTLSKYALAEMNAQLAGRSRTVASDASDASDANKRQLEDILCVLDKVAGGMAQP